MLQERTGRSSGRRQPRLLGAAWQAGVIAVVLGTLAIGVGCGSGYQVGGLPNPTLRMRADQALAEGRVADAEDDLETAIDQAPTDAEAMWRLARVRLEQSRWLDAQLLVERAITLRNDDRNLSRMIDVLAEALFRQGKVEKLYSVLDEAASGSGSPRAFLRQANYLERSGDVDNALIAYRKAVRFADPDAIEPVLALADFAERAHARRLAVRALRRALTIDPEREDVRERLRGYGLVPGPTLYLQPDELLPPIERMLDSSPTGPGAGEADVAPPPATGPATAQPIGR